MRISLNGQVDKTTLKASVEALDTLVKGAAITTKLDGIPVASMESIVEQAQMATVNDLTAQLDQGVISAFGLENFNDTNGQITNGAAIVATPAQRKAAVITAMAFADPRAYITKGYGKVSDIGMEGAQQLVHATSNGLAGELDFRDAPCVGVEAFDESEVRKHIPFSIAFNFQAARQDDFSEAFYPTIVVTPDQAGLDIGVRRGVVFNTVRHNIDGRVADFNRKNIIDAFVDASILENESTYLVPVYVAGGSGNSALFSTIVGQSTTTIEGVSVTTAPLKAGLDLDLVGLSSHPGLIESGVMDHTDSVDGRVALKKIYLKSGSQAIAISTLKLPRSGFNKSPEGEGRELGLQFSSTSLLIDEGVKAVDGTDVTELASIVTGGFKARISIRISGSINLETGNVTVGTVGSIALVSLKDADGEDVSTASGAGATVKAKIAALTLDSYDLEARRTNANKRTRGLLVESHEYVERYTIPLGSPISTPAPIGTTRDSADMQNLITVARIRNSNNAITQLLNYAGVLEDQVINGEVNAVPQIEGIGRWLVKPWFERQEVDVLADIQSVSTKDRRADLAALLVNNIRDMAYRAYRDSRYQAALDALTGGQGARPRLVIGTDQVLIQHLIVEGDSRLVGLAFDHVVVSTMDSRFYGKIAFSFVRSDVAGEPDPLSFGLHAWIPELTSVVQMNRNGATYKETMVQPRTRHINILPILGLIEVTNLHEGLVDQTPIPVEGLVLQPPVDDTP